jgi:hypothetical protein
MRNIRERVVLLPEEKRHLGREDGFNEIHRGAKTGIQIRGECGLLSERIKSSGPSLSLAFGALAPAELVGQVSHRDGDHKKSYEHNSIVKFVDIKREARRDKDKVP